MTDEIEVVCARPVQDGVQTLKSCGIRINTQGKSCGTDTIRMHSSLSNTIIVKTIFIILLMKLNLDTDR